MRRFAEQNFLHEPALPFEKKLLLAGGDYTLSHDVQSHGMGRVKCPTRSVSAGREIRGWKPNHFLNEE
jgi:hypothetical protein